MALTTPRIRPIVLAGALLGCGMGGFADGIVFHQILQWHNMLSNVRPPDDLPAMKYNMRWDGLFHAVAWLVTAVGIARLWAAGRRDTRWSTRAFVGGLCFGWGLFNALEGLVNHQLLALHHVHPGTDQLAWDLGFLASGALLLAVGITLLRTVQSRVD